MLLIGSSALHGLVCEGEREEMKEEEGQQRKVGREDGRTDKKMGKWKGAVWVDGVGG